MAKGDADKTDAAPVRVRITKMGTTAAGCVFAAGAVITLPLGKAKALEALGKAAILGAP